jgi:hypothetical protein
MELWTVCRILVNNIKIDLGEIGWGGLDWIDLAQECWEILEYMYNWQLFNKGLAPQS